MTATIIQGDALDTLRLLPSAHFAAAVTSPPYNLGHSNPPGKAGPGGVARKGRWKGEYAGGFDDALPVDEYIAYHRAVVRQMLRVLKSDGLIWYVHRPKSDHLPTGMLPLPEQILQSYPVRSRIVWHKGGPGAGFCAAGRTGGAYYPTPAYETIYLLAKGKGALLDRQIAAAGDVWLIGRERVPGHPAAFPLALAQRCLDATLAEGPALDPFAGTGTTGKAAMVAGRDFTGIELSAEYAELARIRIGLAEEQARQVAAQRALLAGLERLRPADDEQARQAAAQMRLPAGCDYSDSPHLADGCGDPGGPDCRYSAVADLPRPM